METIPIIDNFQTTSNEDRNPKKVIGQTSSNFPSNPFNVVQGYWGSGQLRGSLCCCMIWEIRLLILLS